MVLDCLGRAHCLMVGLVEHGKSQSSYIYDMTFFSLSQRRTEPHDLLPVPRSRLPRMNDIMSIVVGYLRVTTRPRGGMFVFFFWRAAFRVAQHDDLMFASTIIHHGFHGRIPKTKDKLAGYGLKWQRKEDTSLLHLAMEAGQLFTGLSIGRHMAGTVVLI